VKTLDILNCSRPVIFETNFEGFIVPTLRRGNVVTDAPASVGIVSLSRRMVLKSGLGPTAEVLFFACPKKRNPPAGAGTGIKTSFAIAKQKKISTLG
jgi:hypothetical protein